MEVMRFSLLMAFYKNDVPASRDRALDSVFNNSILPSQLVLIQDGPITLELSEVALKWKARHSSVIDIVELGVNSGLANALNAGLMHAKHEWVFRADSDDVNRPRRFEITIDFIKKNHNATLVGGQIAEYSNNGIFTGFRNVPLSHSNVAIVSRFRNPFNHMTVAFRKSDVIAVGGYPNITFREDYALWCLLLDRGCLCVNLPDVLVDVSAGVAMIERRSGLVNVYGEISLQRFLFLNTKRSLILSCFSGFLRSVLLLAPKSFKRALYFGFLRSRKIL